MIDVAAVQRAFPELENIIELPVNSGQKYVLSATRNTSPAALKLYKRGLADLPRIEREIRAVSKLNSTYVPRILDSGTREILGDQILFILEEFIHGNSYRDRLNAKPIQELRSVLQLLFHLLRACRDFEREKIVHRDIKPENLMLDPAEKLWVIDFGFARHLDLKSLTGDSPYGGVGTLAYAAPEQFQNIKAEINTRTDLFAVGTVVYEALAGFNPFREGLYSLQAVLKRMENETIPLLQCPNDTSGLLPHFIANLIQRFPSRRPQSATEALAWFDPIRTHYNLTSD